MSKLINKLLKSLEDGGHIGLLSRLVYLMYKLKGKKIKGVRFIEKTGVWEFRIGEDYFYSSGPGWAYDYNYLLEQFKEHLGNKYLPKEGDVVVDVGAGVGEELMLFSKRVGSKGKVFAIEAHPKTFQALAYNNKMNGFTNTTLLNLAIADVPGHIYIEDTSNSLSNSVTKSEVEKGFKVEAITIEQMMDKNNLAAIDFMKVNIEGAEQFLIKGIGSKLSRIRHMAISCHDFRYHTEGIEFFKTKEIVLDYLRKNNIEFVTRETGNPLLDDYIYTFPAKDNDR